MKAPMHTAATVNQKAPGRFLMPIGTLRLDQQSLPSDGRARELSSTSIHRTNIAPR